MKINIRLTLTGVLLVLFLAGTVFLIKRNKPVPSLPPRSVLGASGSSAVLKVKGPATAPVVIVEYSDFECPSCSTSQDVLREILREYPGKVQIQFKHYPLTAHKWSLYAHQAAECMNLQGKFWQYHDLLYGKQMEWATSTVPPVEILARYALETGANMDLFGACLTDDAVKGAVSGEKEEGNQRQVNATPTFFIGQERFVGPKELKERGVNEVRKILGLPPKPIPEKKQSPAPVFPTGIPKQGTSS
jgi:protein-disulfide isomerase